MPPTTSGVESSPRRPSSFPQSPNKLQKARPGSRTMEYALGMTSSTSISATKSTAATRWRAPSNAGQPRSFTAIAPSQSKTPVALSKTSKVYDAIYDYFRPSAQRILHPITTIEHYWAIRATIAETRLRAHEVHRQELAAMSASPGSRELIELNAKYERELARIKLMMWTILVALGILLSLLVIILVRHVPASTPSHKGSVHFTIPILSPFASVIEHETSAVNVPLVAVLLLLAGISLFVWLRCCGSRR